MKQKKVLLGMGLAMVLALVVIPGCIEDKDDEDEATITINGDEVTLSSIFDDHTTTTFTIGGTNYTGVTLSALVNETGLLGPENYQYNITASDGWYQTVTWENMQEGIIVEKETMTAFPGLPGKYRIRDVVDIDPVTAKTITVNHKLFVWPQVFHIIDSDVELMDDENNSYEGVYLSSAINITGLSDQGTRTYNLIGADGNNQTVTWEDMTKGILVEDDIKCFFPHLAKKFHISDIAEIEVI